MRAVAFALLLSTSTAAVSHRAPSPDDLSNSSIEELLQTVRERKNSVDRKVFDELGKRGSRQAYEALVEATKIVTSQWSLRYAYQAVAQFKDTPAISETAMEFLFDEAGTSDVRNSSSATHALSLFGAPAHPKLRRVLKNGKHPLTRSAALAPLLPDMAAGGEKSDFKTTYENLHLTYMVHRPLGVEAFKTFAATGGVQLFKNRLSDKKIRVEVRGMMISALEATEGQDSIEILMNGLKARDPRILFETLRALRRRGTTQHQKDLGKLARSKDDTVRHEALISMARIHGSDPGYLDKILDWSEARDPIDRGAAAISLGELRTPEAMEALHALLEDPEFSVRVEALLAIAAARQISSINVLIRRLDVASGAERDRTAYELRLLTGEDHGARTGRWAEWWKDKADTFALPSKEDAMNSETKRSNDRSSNITKSNFYGLDVSSSRVCFVVDLSGSMNSRTKSGKTRLEVLKFELDRFLADYPSGDLFNMIFFGNDAKKWKPALTFMSDEVRREARSHIRTLTAPGATAVYDGIAAAFEDPLVDTIYLLTDGGPSGGTIDDIDEIIMEVGRWNSIRHLVIHSIAVGRRSTLLEALSRDSRGTYVVVD